MPGRELRVGLWGIGLNEPFVPIEHVVLLVLIFMQGLQWPQSQVCVFYRTFGTTRYRPRWTSQICSAIARTCWAPICELRISEAALLADEAADVFAAQKLDGSIVFTSSANAIVPKKGSEAYDVSKAALSHLIRELAISFDPEVRVNGISPARVVKGSTMFPRDRVITSLKKYDIDFDPSATDDQLRDSLAAFYAKRTLTNQPIEPDDCARAILFLASPQARCTTGHLFPVDGGLPEAFLR
jgi:NAD(P)-dependent dehydrogenase (short-subunit alcohol dehydrogenase family)